MLTADLGVYTSTRMVSYLHIATWRLSLSMKILAKNLVSSHLRDIWVPNRPTSASVEAPDKLVWRIWCEKRIGLTNPQWVGC